MPKIFKFLKQTSHVRVHCKKLKQDKLKGYELVYKTFSFHLFYKDFFIFFYN